MDFWILGSSTNKVYSWFRRFRRKRVALLGLFLIGALTGAAFLAPFLAPYAVQEQDLTLRLTGPSLEHPLGLDELGRDILSRLIFGARTSLWVGVSVVSVSLLLGTAIGCLAGYSGGLTDEALMRIVDILLAFPGILLAIAMVAVLGPGMDHLILALCTIGWVGFARLARAQVLKIRETDYVTAARALGGSSARIILLHVIPNILGPLMVQATFGIAAVILAEAGLSFLGLGIQPPDPSWGSMLRSGCEHILDTPHLTLYPGSAIAATVLGFNFLGDSMRELLDPRSPGEVLQERTAGVYPRP